MTSIRTPLALAVSPIALVTAQAATAQTTLPTPPTLTNEDSATAPAEAPQTDIVVTGTGTAGRSRFDSTAPIDVLSANTLQHRELDRAGRLTRRRRPIDRLPALVGGR